MILVLVGLAHIWHNVQQIQCIAACRYRIYCDVTIHGKYYIGWETGNSYAIIYKNIYNTVYTANLAVNHNNGSEPQ